MKRCGTWLAGHAPEIIAVIVPLVYCAFFLAPARKLGADQALLGLVHTDQVVYYALAREAFESGNGLVYASPYSNLPDSPRIYSHFGFLAIGYVWKLTGLSLPSLDYLLRAVFGAAMMLLIVRLFRAALPQGTPIWFGAAGVILLSGIAWLIGLLQYAQDTLMGAGPPNWEGYLRAFWQAESGYGEWYLNVFGNLAFVHELMFHTLFFGATLALARGRAWLAILLLVLTWWSHPYTGLHLGLIIGLFLIVEVSVARMAKAENKKPAEAGSKIMSAREPPVEAGGNRVSPLKRATMSNNSMLLKLGTAAIINALFIGYYLLCLPRFEEHASVYAQMRQFSHPMLFSKLPAAYGLFLALPLFYAVAPDFRRLLKESAAARLMLGWLAITAALIFHDRILFFMKPFQPMHFTRGYLFVPLLYFSACAMGWLKERYRWPPRKFAIILILLFLLQLPDNTIRTAQLRHDVKRQPYLYFIPQRDVELLKWIDAIRPTMTIHAVDSGELERMIPVLTHHRSVLGHLYNTPFRDEKTRLVDDFVKKLDAKNLRALHIDALVVPASSLDRLRASLGPNGFEVLFQQADMCLVRIR